MAEVDDVEKASIEPRRNQPRDFSPVVSTLSSTLLTLLAVTILILAIGSNPWDAAKAIVNGSITKQFISDVWPDPFSQKTTSIAENAQFPEFWDKANVDISVFIAIIGAAVAWFIINRTALGFSIRAIGANPNASRLAGVRTRRVTVLTFVIAGGFAGLAGAVAVAGIFDDLDISFSSN